MKKHLEKVLVTGGAGYVGSHTAIVLAEAGYEPLIVDNFCNAKMQNIKLMEQLIKRRIIVYKSDCTNVKAMEKIFVKEKDIAGVIHFAAFKSVRESVKEPLLYYRNNIGALTGTLAAQLKCNVPYMIFSSSCTVYGQAKKLPVKENAPLDSKPSPYGFSKQAGERIIEDVCHTSGTVKAIALRYFNPIGAHPSGKLGEYSLSRFQNFVPLVMDTLMDPNKHVTILGNDYPTKDGTCVRDYVHVMDVARAHVQALKYVMSKAAPDFDIFNIGLGRGYSVLEILKEVEKATGQRIIYKVGPRGKGDVAATYADITKARQVLGFKTEFTIEDAMQHAWKWHITRSK